MNRRNEKKRVKAHLRVCFKSFLAEHEDVYFCNINVWREGDLFPSPFRELVWEGDKGSKAEVEISGNSFFNYDMGENF